MKCPACGGVLAAARYDATPMMSCPGCGGVWCSSGRLAQAAGTAKDLPPVAAKATLSTKLCPECPAPLAMDERPYLDHTPLRIDVCAACEGVWFDRGELREALRLRRTRAYYRKAVDPTVADAVAHCHQARRALRLPIQFGISPGGLIVGGATAAALCFHDICWRRRIFAVENLHQQWLIVLLVIVAGAAIGAFTPDLRPAKITRR